MKRSSKADRANVGTRRPRNKTSAGQTFRDYNPATVSPWTGQTPPTDECPIRTRHQQGGVK